MISEKNHGIPKKAPVARTFFSTTAGFYLAPFLFEIHHSCFPEHFKKVSMEAIQKTQLKKLSSPLWIFLVNVTKSAISCGFCDIY